MYIISSPVRLFSLEAIYVRGRKVTCNRLKRFTCHRTHKRYPSYQGLRLFRDQYSHYMPSKYEITLSLLLYLAPPLYSPRKPGSDTYTKLLVLPLLLVSKSVILYHWSPFGLLCELPIVSGTLWEAEEGLLWGLEDPVALLLDNIHVLRQTRAGIKGVLMEIIVTRASRKT